MTPPVLKIDALELQPWGHPGASQANDRYQARVGFLGRQLGEIRHAIRTGNVIACPSRGPDTAHQIVDELRFTVRAGESLDY